MHTVSRSNGIGCNFVPLYRSIHSSINQPTISNVVARIIEIINNTRGGIVIFFTDNKRERVYWGANSSPGCRARRLLAELMLP